MPAPKPPESGEQGGGTASTPRKLTYRERIFGTTQEPAKPAEGATTQQPTEGQNEKPAPPNLIPDEKDMEAARFGALSTFDLRPERVIDLGGKLSMAEAIKKNAEFGEGVNLDRAFYDRMSDIAQIMREWQNEGKKDKLAGLTHLQRKILAKFPEWETRAKAIDALKTGKDKKAYTGNERIIQSGEEMKLIEAFLMESEILAAGALGSEATNGGERVYSFTLDNRKIDFLQQAEMPGRVRQAVHEIAQALHLSDPEERKQIITGALVTAGTAGGVGTLVACLSGNPAFGAMIGAGAGIYVSAAGIEIGNWLMRFPDSEPGKPIQVELQYRDNLPGDPNRRITENPIAKQFLGLGEKTHVHASDFLLASQMTRHALYRRLGLRIEKHSAAAFDWDHLTPEQTDFIRRSIGFDRDPKDLSPAQRTQIQHLAGIGADLGMVDTAAFNMSMPAGNALDFHLRVREKVQMILARDHANLPVTQISTDVSYRDFSGLPAAERQRIKLEAVNLAASEVPIALADDVIAEFKLGQKEEQTKQAGEVGALDILADNIATGKEKTFKDELAKEQIQRELDQLGSAKDKVSAVERQHGIITDADQKLTEKQEALATTEKELKDTKDEQGERRTGVGIIGQQEQVKKDAIKEANDALNKIDLLGLGVVKPPYAFDETTVNDWYFAIQNRLKVLQHELKVLNPQEASSQASALRATIRGADLSDYLRRIREGNEKNEQITQLEDASQRIIQAQGKLQQAETKIEDAEKAVKQKEVARGRTITEIDSLKDNREKSIGELRRLTDFKEEYGEERYNRLLVTAKANVAEIEKKLTEKGVSTEPGAEIPIAISKEGKEVARAVREIANLSRVGKATVKNEKNEDMDVEGRFNTVLSKLYDGEYDRQAMADPKTSHEEYIKTLWGEEAALDMDFYKRIASKAGIVETYFDYSRMDEAHARDFLANVPDGFTAYQTYQSNKQEINRLQSQIDTIQVKKNSGWENQVQILERQLHTAQDEKVRALHDIYDRKIAPFLSQNQVVFADFTRVFIARMRNNALEKNPFADTVRFTEALGPFTNPDGTVTVRPPDINPTDGAWINRGGTIYNSPSDYRVGTEAVQLHLETPITAAGELAANVQVRGLTLEGVRLVVPDNRADLVGTPVEAELNRLGLLGHLYDAAGHIRGNEAEVVTEILNLLPDDINDDINNAANPRIKLIHDFLQRYGYEASRADTLYNPPAAPGSLDRARNNTEAQRLIREAVGRQLADVTLNIRGAGFANTLAVEQWLQTDSHFHLGEPRRLLRSFARAAAENPRVVNRELLGDRFNRVTVGGGRFQVDNEDGELMMYYNDAGGLQHTLSLRELITIQDPAQRATRVPGLTDVYFNRMLLYVGESSLEAIRQRTP